MSTIALQTRNFNEKNMRNHEKKSLFRRFMEYYRENSAEIMCGLLLFSGDSHGYAYETYRLLKK